MNEVIHESGCSVCTVGQCAETLPVSIRANQLLIGHHSSRSVIDLFIRERAKSWSETEKHTPLHHTVPIQTSAVRQKISENYAISISEVYRSANLRKTFSNNQSIIWAVSYITAEIVDSLIFPYIASCINKTLIFKHSTQKPRNQWVK